jgi:hypothetical protein
MVARRDVRARTHSERFAQPVAVFWMPTRKHGPRRRATGGGHGTRCLAGISRPWRFRRPSLAGGRPPLAAASLHHKHELADQRQTLVGGVALRYSAGRPMCATVAPQSTPNFGRLSAHHQRFKTGPEAGKTPTGHRSSDGFESR